MKTDITPEELKRRIIVIPLVRREKVEETRRRLQSGIYRIDTTAVARSLLKECILAEVLVSA